MKTICALVLVLCSYAASGAFASGGIDPDKSLGEQPQLSDMSTAEAVGKLAMAVGIVAVMGAGAYYFSKKALPGLGRGSGRMISVVESVSLGARKHVYVVRVGQRQFLLGSSAERLSLLADLSGCQEQFGGEAASSAKTVGAGKDE